MRPATRLAAAFAVLVPLSAVPAAADSCWDHNGSLMRLVANGNERAFLYEEPRAALRAGGVAPGTLLFDGARTGDRYVGTAHVFSRFCPGEPLEYAVEGAVRSDDLQVVLRGTREVHDRCRPTGRTVTDTLVFTYVRAC